MESQKFVPQLAIISPCFNEEEVLQTSIAKLIKLLNSLSSANKISENSYLCLVDDGSQDQTWEIICKNNKKLPQKILGVKLSHNVGHQNAILAGMMENLNVDCVITIDVDLQDDLNAIELMVEKYKNGCEIVLGVKNKRTFDSFFKRITANSFYTLLSILKVPMVVNHADFRLIGKKALNALTFFEERNLYLRSLILHIGFRVETVDYNLQKREKGQSKYTFFKMLSLALSGITSFSIFPLRLVTFMGFCFFMLSLSLILKAFFGYNYGIVVPGWTSIIASIYLLGGVQLLCMGIIGEYIGKIYTEVIKRPRYIVEQVLKK